MAEQERMDPDELRARREYLGFTEQAFGVAVGMLTDRPPVRKDTVHRWESGRDPIPYGLPDTLALLERQTDDLVAGMIAGLRRGDRVVWAEHDDAARFLGRRDWATARWWRHAAVRAMMGARPA